MALDRSGKLYIFELKAWEAASENLLQVLRYGQIFGGSKYDDLEKMFQRRRGTTLSLREAMRLSFGSTAPDVSINASQVFVVMTNGLDFSTREAIRYWRSTGLDVRPWVYRVYPGRSEAEFNLDISPFRVEDNPYEDIAEGYYILNTNFNNCPRDHEEMLQEKKAAAYYVPWKHKIDKLVRGDVVFLFQSGVGIVAVGEADGKRQTANYHGEPTATDEEHFMKLTNFTRISPPLAASEIKQITGVNYRFLSTMFGLSEDAGRVIRQHLSARA